MRPAGSNGRSVSCFSAHQQHRQGGALGQGPGDRAQARRAQVRVTAVAAHDDQVAAVVGGAGGQVRADVGVLSPFQPHSGAMGGGCRQRLVELLLKPAALGQQVAVAAGLCVLGWGQYGAGDDGADGEGGSGRQGARWNGVGGIGRAP